MITIRKQRNLMYEAAIAHMKPRYMGYIYVYGLYILLKAHNDEATKSTATMRTQEVVVLLYIRSVVLAEHEEEIWSLDKHSAAAGFRIISEIKETRMNLRCTNTFDLGKKQSPEIDGRERSRAESTSTHRMKSWRRELEGASPSPARSPPRSSPSPPPPPPPRSLLYGSLPYRLQLQDREDCSCKGSRRKCIRRVRLRMVPRGAPEYIPPASRASAR